MEEPVAEYYRTARIRAVSITEADLEELRRTVVEDIGSDESVTLTIESEEGDRRVEAHDVASFAKQMTGARSMDFLDIRFYFHSESRNSGITKYVHVGLCRRTGIMGSRLYISSSDQTWCYGKIQVLVAFLRRKRVWYWGIAGEGLSWALCTVFGIQLGLFLGLLQKHGSTSRVLISVFSLLVAIGIYWLAALGTLFPGFTFSRAGAPRSSLMKNQAFWTMLACIFGGGGFLVALATFILQLLR